MSPETRESMLQVISDLSKDARGYRVRLNYEAMNDEELQATWDGFLEEADQANIEEARCKLAAQKEWELHLNKLMELGAGNRATALRWDMDAMDCGHDVSYYCYNHDLDYALEHRIKEDLHA